MLFEITQIYDINYTVIIYVCIFFQRFDYSVLTPFLPPKHEYVIYLKLSDKQIELYQKYLNYYRQPDLFTNYNMLQIVWTHPKLLAVYAERTQSKREV